LGCSQSRIGDIERGARRVRRAEFLAIARALGRDPGELVDAVYNGRVR
jgi:transcriptional regulator with XRE-family HTH domain